MNQLSNKEYSISYVDASPSELLHNSKEKYICISLVYFFYLKKEKLKKISQFKKTRGIKRKLSTQNYIIESIKNGFIAPAGLSNWNFREIALKNGKHILKEANIITNQKEYHEIISIGNEHLSYGHSISLGWYSFVLATFLSQVGKIAKITNKNNAVIFLDLLSGDRINDLRSFNVLEYIIDNSELLDFQIEAIKNNNLEKLGYAYGTKNGTTKGLKNDFEYVITDWIAQSFHSLLKYEKEKLEKTSEEYQLSKLAKYLIDEKVFKIYNAIDLI